MATNIQASGDEARARSGWLWADRYRVIQHLGATARSRTMLAIDRERSEQVVVKTRHTTTLSPLTCVRFLDECRRLKELRSVTPRPLLDAGREGDELYVVMPFVPGVSLQERLGRRHLSVPEALRIAICVCTTLQVLHARRILHRSVKPANIIVGETGTIQRATLIDPGIMVDELLCMPDSTALGSVLYLSPEQTGSVDLDVGEAADLYSVGIVLFQCLAGHTPFGAPTVGEVLYQHMTAPVPQLQTSFPVPHVVDEVIQRLLRKDPRDRYQSATGVVQDLLSILTEMERGNAAPNLVLGAADQRHTLTEPAFVGRELELDTIAAEVEAVRAKGSQLLLLEGPTGSGKSRLLAEVARRCVLEGMWVFRSAATNDLDHAPLQPFQRIVHDFTAAAHRAPDLAAAVWRDLGDDREGVVAAFPHLARELGWAVPAAEAPAVHEMRRIKGVAQFLNLLGTSHRPAVVILDDCQWCDELAIRLLECWHALTRRPQNAARRVLLIAAYRVEEVPESHPLRQLHGAAQIALSPLETGAIEHLVRSMAGPVPDAVTDTVVRLSAGSPFMASALLRGLVESGAMWATEQGWKTKQLELDKLRSSHQAGEVLAHRIELLPARATQVLQAAAILGVEFDLGVVAGLTRQSQTDLLAALDKPRQRHLVWIRPNGYQAAFTHDKVRTMLLAGMTEQERQNLHLAAAIQLKQQLATPAAQLAYHFDAAGDSVQALPFALEAAEQARVQHAYEVAEQQYRIAERGSVEAAPAVRYRVAWGLGDTLMQRGKYDDAESWLERAIVLATDDYELASCRGKLGELAVRRGDLALAAKRLESALESLGQTIPRSFSARLRRATFELVVQLLHTLFPSLLVHRRHGEPPKLQRLTIRLLSRLSYTYWFTHPRSAGLWAHLRGLNLAERYAPSADLAQLYAEHGPGMTLISCMSRGIRYVERSLEIRRRLGDSWGQGQSLSYYSLVLYAASRFGECAARARHGIELLERTGDYWQVHIARFEYSTALFRLGKLKQALAEAKLHYQSGVEVGDEQARAYALEVWARATHGAVPEELMEQELARTRVDTLGIVQVLFARGLQQCGLGRYQEAATAFEAADTHARKLGVQNVYTVSQLPWLVTCKRRLAEECTDRVPDRRRRLLHDARQALRQARRAVRHYTCELPHLLREEGLILAMEGRPWRARWALDQSLRIAKRQAARYEYAQSLWVRGRLGKEYGWAAADRQLRTATSMLAKLTPPESAERHTNRPTPGPTTLSLVDRFGGVLDAGRRIAAALSPAAVFREVQAAALHLLRGEHCLILALTHTDSGLDIGVWDSDQPFQRALVEIAIEKGRATAFGPDRGPESAGAPAEDDKSTICVPIFVRGRPVACVYVTHHHMRGLFGSDEEKLADFIGTIAGAALENAEGFQQLQRLNETLEQRVADRTAAAELRNQELARSNAQLERIASELLMREEDLREAMQAAEAATRIKSQFLATMSHEIRTPMNGIIGMTELALKTTINAQQRNYLTTLSQSADALMRLLNDVLDISKIEAGRMELEQTDFDLPDTILDALRVQAMPANEKGLEVSCRIAAGVPREAVGDPGRLRQIIVNLVGNAVKFTPQGEVFVDCQLEASSAQQFAVRITVLDTGTGIAPDRLEHIFDSFSQQDASITRRNGGAGLGLAISAQLVQLMKGHIWVDSEPGSGSQFHFTATFGRPKGTPSVTQSVPLLVNRRILLLDPDPQQRDIHLGMLQELGWPVTQSRDIVTALRKLEQAVERREEVAAVVVVATVHEPAVSWSRVERVSRVAGRCRVPVILVLPASEQNETTRIAKLHIARCVPKPAKPAELQKALLGVLGLDAHRRRSPSRPVSPQDGRPLRILLAEDCLVNQEVAIGLLELQGHSITVANNGREAVLCAQQQDFDVILMDVEMPEMDGLQATGQIRRWEAEQGRYTPIIAMTAHALRGFQSTCQEAGMDDYVSKPVDANKLYRAVSKAAAQKRLPGLDAVKRPAAPLSSGDK